MDDNVQNEYRRSRREALGYGAMSAAVLGMSVLWTAKGNFDPSSPNVLIDLAAYAAGSFSAITSAVRAREASILGKMIARYKNQDR